MPGADPRRVSSQGPDGSVSAAAVRAVVDISARLGRVDNAGLQAALDESCTLLREMSGATGVMASCVCSATQRATRAAAGDLSGADAVLVEEALRAGSPGGFEHDRLQIATTWIGDPPVAVAIGAAGATLAGVDLLLQLVSDAVATAAARGEAHRLNTVEDGLDHALVHETSDLVLVIDPGGRVTFVNRAARRQFGYEPGSLLDRSAFDLLHPDDLPNATDVIAAVIAGGTLAAPFELRVLDSRGEYHWIEMVASNRLDDPAVNGIVITARDISRQRATSDALAESEARSRALIDNSNDILSVIGIEGGWSMTSAVAAARILGYDDGLPYENIFERIHPDDLAFAEATFTEIFAGARGPDQPAVIRVANAAGEYRYIETAAVNLIDNPAVRGVLTNSRDVTERVEATQKLEATNNRLQALIAHIRDGIVMLDDEQRVVLVNDGFRALFDMKDGADGLVGLRAADAMACVHLMAADPDAHRSVVRAEAAAGRPVRRRELVLADGRVFECDYLPVRSDGVSYGHLWVYHDVSKQRQFEQSLKDALEEARVASSAKSHFVAAVSHEIRTPMHGVLGLLELLGQHDMPDAQRQLLNTAYGSARSLRSMLDDLLDFAKIEADRMELEAVPFDPSAVIEQVTNVLQPVVVARDLELQLHAAPDLPAHVVGDPNRLRQILSNLLDNAVKFTERGTITVSAGLLKGDDRTATIRVSVADTGTGIPADAVAGLFAPFSQVAGERRKAVRGTGLGLAISRQLAQMMHGSLDVESEFGVGSTFTLVVTLERPATPEAVVPAAATGETSSQARAARVFVVEDEPVNQLIARKQLEKLGHVVEIVGTGEDAVERFRPGDFDVVLMDRQLPGIDGLEATRRIRCAEAASGSHVPIIAMTASAYAEDERACLASGMDGYVAKPVSIGALQEAIDAVLAA